MDIRGRCNPINDPLTWENCSAKIHSTLFYIENEYEKYKQYDKYECVGCREERNAIICEIATQNKYLDESETDDLVELLNQRDENDANGQYDCICCDAFVFACDEDNCRFDGDVEGLICWNCIPEHFCEDCDEYYATVIEPDICGKYICYSCEESRLNAFKEAQQEKADKKKKINDEIAGAWKNIKNDMEEWVYDYTTDDTSSIDDLKELVSALNVMLNEIGTEPLDL
jgi:hypothetical protein